MDYSSALNAINHTLQQNNRYLALHNKLLIEVLTEIRKSLDEINNALKSENG